MTHQHMNISGNARDPMTCTDVQYTGSSLSPPPFGKEKLSTKWEKRNYFSLALQGKVPSPSFFSRSARAVDSPWTIQDPPTAVCLSLRETL
jgi:hypothetical protein